MNISTVDYYSGTIPTYGGTVKAFLVNNVCWVNIKGLGTSSNVPSGAWRYINLGLPVRFQQGDNKVAMLNFGGSEDAESQFLCHLIDSQLSFYCYHTVTSGQADFCYLIL